MFSGSVYFYYIVYQMATKRGSFAPELGPELGPELALHEVTHEMAERVTRNNELAARYAALVARDMAAMKDRVSQEAEETLERVKRAAEERRGREAEYARQAAEKWLEREAQCMRNCKLWHYQMQHNMCRTGISYKDALLKGV